ncbi:DNA-binding transcriptional regulator YhcF (GntR family) [Haloactinopolyspora alba]|uniref:DNA-binding transcriptional regulator YhcF (GntR family) n=1 Tax=Haloactinopolyspora alba TaxID=648780 RepID=A0A2P8DPR3_9ACTN|nr:GntR family transcriptional regulator [Haloactinopolyspora alba]PSK99196.1 DNA-binding transcriptional regulator YhcF (GntR family) [Haloactinopolyspora alba]
MTAAEAVVIDTSSPTPPYEQIRRQITAQVAAGRLPLGARLPSVRQLAADLGIAAGTVARAYRELEADGVVQARLRGGTRVTAAPPELDTEHRSRRLHEAATEYVRAARLTGADDDALLDAVRAALRARDG